MDSASLDRFDLPDKQTIAVKLPSIDNQVPKLDSLCVAHRHDLYSCPSAKATSRSTENRAPAEAQLAASQLPTPVEELQRNLQRKFQRPSTKRVTSVSEKINDVQGKIVLARL